jgi:two-component system alkaline phosphatase synthesis response regulator PhoP
LQSIFVVEDDDSIREMVMYALDSAGFETAGFADGSEVFPALAKNIPSLILLDIMLPGKDGISILRQMKQIEKLSQIPVIMLTAKGSEIDRIKGLDMGADDYITKPFSVMEVVSRVRAVLRRSNNIEQSKNEYSVCGITLNSEKHTVFSDGQNISLTFKEFELLHYMMLNKGIVLSRDRLLEQVWGFDYNGESRTVDMHIKSLRQKLGNASSVITTVRNVGYKIGV